MPNQTLLSAVAILLIEITCLLSNYRCYPLKCIGILYLTSIGSPLILAGINSNSLMLSMTSFSKDPER